MRGRARRERRAYREGAALRKRRSYREGAALRERRCAEGERRGEKELRERREPGWRMAQMEGAARRPARMARGWLSSCLAHHRQ